LDEVLLDTSQVYLVLHDGLLSWSRLRFLGHGYFDSYVRGASCAALSSVRRVSVASAKGR